MDLNRLYFDHQLLLMRRRGSGPSPLRAAAARVLAGRIGTLQHALGAPGAAGWQALATAPAGPSA